MVNIVIPNKNGKEIIAHVSVEPLKYYVCKQDHEIQTHTLASVNIKITIQNM